MDSEKFAVSAQPYPLAASFFVSFHVLKEAPPLARLCGTRIYITDLGERVQTIWKLLPERFPNVRLGPFAILPDRLHCVIHLTQGPSQPDFCEVIDDFLSMVGEEYTLMQAQQFSRIAFRRSLLHSSYSASPIKDNEDGESLLRFLEAEFRRVSEAS